MPTGFAPPPTALVEQGRQQLGRFDGALQRANLIDAHYRHLPRPLRWWRLKEWQAFQIATPQVFVNLALFDAKAMGLRQVKIYDRARGQKYLDETKLLPGTLDLADQLLASTNSHRDRHGHLTLVNAVASKCEITFELAARAGHPALAGRITVHSARGASQVVSLPFAGDVGMYSHKGMFPAEGELTIGGETHRFAVGEGLALMDDHKGYYPYVMKWDWVTSATHDASGRALGVNLTRNQCRDPEHYNENCAWIGERIGRLPAVTMVRENARQPGERWLIRDRDGRVDLVFEPTVPGDVAVNALVVESRYRGPFGLLSGRVEPEGLEPIAVDRWFGMGEEFWLRC